MKQIKTYEGFFDFFKKVNLDRLAEECRKILSGESKEIKETKSESRRYEWRFSKSFEEKSLIFNVKLGSNALFEKAGSFLLHIQCEDPDDDEISDYISLVKEGKDLLNDLEFHITYNIKKCSSKVLELMESKEFFLDHPEEDIRNYIVDLEDALGDTIQLDKSYHMGGWKMQFHISRDSENFDSTKSEIDEQIKMLEELLNGVNLSLVDLERSESKLRTAISKRVSNQVYGHRFLIKDK